MRALNRKILRDLGHLKGQAAAIALVIASGVMTLVIAVTSLDALTITKERFAAASRRVAGVGETLVRVAILAARERTGRGRMRPDCVQHQEIIN